MSTIEGGKNMNLKPHRRKMSGIIIPTRRRFEYERSRRQPIIYRESKEPEILKISDEEKPFAIAFNDSGKRYIFSNNDGHVVIFSTNDPQNQARRPMTKKEFEEIKEKMTDKAQTAQEKAELLSEINELDFAKGHANAVFNVLTYINGENKVRALAININFSRYVYSLEDERLISVDTSRKRTTTEITDENKKNEITHKMFASKTLQKKINEVHQKGMVK